MSVWDDTRKLQLVGNDVAIPVVEMSSEDTEDLIHRADLLGVKTRVDNSVPLTRSKKVNFSQLLIHLSLIGVQRLELWAYSIRQPT